MKKFVALVMSLVMCLSFVSFGGITAAAESDDVIELRFSHHNATTDLIHEAAEKWADAVEEATDGHIKITVYPAAQLGTSTEAMEAVELGNLDMCLGDPGVAVTEIPEYGVTLMPFLMSDYDEAFDLFYNSDVVTTIDEMMIDRLGVRPLGWSMNGFRCMATKTPIYKISDCEGIKFRSPETQVYIDLFEMLGFNPVLVSWSDSYIALQSGIADGVCAAPQYLYVNDFYKICNNICVSRHFLSVIGPVINEDVWQSLDKEDQDAIQNCWLEVRDEWLNPAVMQSDDDYLEKLADEGCTITEFEDRQELIDLFAPYWEQSAKDGGYEDLMQETFDVLGM